MIQQTPAYEHFLHHALDSLEFGHLSQLRTTLNHALPAIEIARLIESASPKEQSILWRLLRLDLRAQVIEHLEPALAGRLASEDSHEDLASYIEHLDDDDAADLIATLPQQLLDRLLSMMKETDRDRLEQMLSYPPDSAGGLMNTDIITIPQGVTLAVLQRYLRALPEVPQGTDRLYVVEPSQGHLVGHLSVVDLLRFPLDQTAQQCMKDAPHLMLTDTVSMIVKTFEKHDLISAAVVDDKGRPVGRITVDDVVDAITEDRESRLRGIGYLLANDSLFAPIQKSLTLRAVWLGINLLTTFVTVGLVTFYADTVTADIRLAAIAPSIASMSGIATTQVFTLILRSIAQDYLVAFRWRYILSRELLVGMASGLVWGVLLGALVGLFTKDLFFGLLIGVSMLISMIWGCAWGAVMPLILRRLKVDAALAGGVVLTTFTDFMGYFSLLGLSALSALYIHPWLTSFLPI